MKVKEYYMRGRLIHVNSGDVARVWEDSLNGLPAMRVQYPQLFSICTMPEITVDKPGGVETGDRCAVMLCMMFVTRRGTRHGTCAGLEAQTYVPRGNVPVA